MTTYLYQVKLDGEVKGYVEGGKFDFEGSVFYTTQGGYVNLVDGIPTIQQDGKYNGRHPQLIGPFPYSDKAANQEIEKFLGR